MKDDGRESVNKILTFFLISKVFSSYTYKGAVFAERFNRTISDLFKEPDFKEGNVKCVDELWKLPEKYNYNNVHSSTKMRPIQASIICDENEVYNNMKDESEENKPNFNMGDSVRTSNLCKIFSIGDTTIGVITYIQSQKDITKL